MIIKQIDFNTILLVWKNYLWPYRISPIETHSAMMYQSDSISMENFNLPVWFLGAFKDDKLVGVNSGHLCSDGTARSRGLWVNPNYRNQGIGKSLLIKTTEQARHYNATAIWSFPRFSSKKTYEAAGFTISTSWQQSETSDSNAYCILKL